MIDKRQGTSRVRVGDLVKVGYNMVRFMPEASADIGFVTAIEKTGTGDVAHIFVGQNEGEMLTFTFRVRDLEVFSEIR